MQDTMDRPVTTGQMRGDWLNLPKYENPYADCSDLSNFEKSVADDLRVKGYAVIDFPDDTILERADRIREKLTPVYDFEAKRRDPSISLRVQDAVDNEDIREIACSQAILDLLSKVYGRQAFPFQTLNFPVGTEQAAHSDHVHFDSLPHRFMAGVWLALEDIDEDNGGLFYYPGSHNWPALTNLEIGYHQTENRAPQYDRFTETWEQFAEYYGVKREHFHAKAGQCLIWSSNLVHGGSRQLDPNRTRWSQVTHYYFNDCAYYTPVFTSEHTGKIYYRSVKDISTGKIVVNKINGIETPREDVIMQTSDSQVQFEFNADRYLKLNPDVKQAGMDPYRHYLVHGMKEGRRI